MATASSLHSALRPRTASSRAAASMTSHRAPRIVSKQPPNLHYPLHATSQPSPAAARSPFLTVVLPTALTLMLCNMDRICLSVAILPMSQEMVWPASTQGLIQSAFLYGYTATQLLGGTLADKYGGKLVMAGGILWFSAASLLLPLAVSEPVRAAGLTMPAVLAARCMVGLGEGVTLPAMNNLIIRHFPEESKGRALGLAFSGFQSGNLLGLLLSPLLLVQFGWRCLFLIFGMLGAPVLAMWMALVPASAPPKTTKQVSTTPVDDLSSEGCTGSKPELRTDVPATAASRWRPASEIGIPQLLSHPATWAIIIVNMVNHWGYFIYLNWMPTYFSTALGFDLRASSFFSFLPWLVMAAGSSLSGLLSDTLVSRGMPVVAVRRRMQSVAFLVPALALLVLVQPGLRPGPAVAAMTLALSSTSLGLAGYVANMSDIAPHHAGQMYGLCSTFGSLAGIVGVTAVGFIVEATQSFSPAFLLTAGLYVLGTIVWNVMCVGERVF